MQNLTDEQQLNKKKSTLQIDANQDNNFIESLESYKSHADKKMNNLY